MILKQVKNIKFITILLILLAFSCRQKPKKILYKTYFANGQIKELFELNKDSVKDGVFKTFYSTGELASKGWFHNGKNMDSGFVYYKNGQIKEKGTSIDFNKIGWWIYFDSLGHIVKKEQSVMLNNEYPNDTIKEPYVVNQEIIYRNNGTIDTLHSSFFDIKPVRYHKDSLKLHIFATSLKDAYCKKHDSCSTVVKKVIIKGFCQQKTRSFPMNEKKFLDINLKICPNDSIIYGQILDIFKSPAHDSLNRVVLSKGNRYFTINYSKLKY